MVKELMTIKHWTEVQDIFNKEWNTDDLSPINTAGIAMKVAEDMVRGCQTAEGQFGIVFYVDGKQDTVLHFDTNLRETGVLRDKLQAAVTRAVLQAVEEVKQQKQLTWDALVDQFHRFYYYPMGDYRGKNNLLWFGKLMMKCPMDLMLYQELVYETKPDLIIETGTAYGASALYLAHLCDLVGNGRVVSIDTDAQDRLPTHDRLTYIKGSSIDPDILAGLDEMATGSVMVLLDSDHSKQHVLRELDAYCALVTKGNYLIVEDTDINGHPVLRDFGDGPYEALQEWLPNHPQFVVDKDREHYIFSQNSGGYLKKMT